MRSVVALAIMLMTAGGSALAADRYEREVRIRLDRLYDVLSEQGFTQSHNYMVDKLTPKQSENYFIDLEADVEYAIVSVCDSDCTDIDVAIYDENNNRIDIDDKEDAHPAVGVTPEWTGEFRVVVFLPGCTANRCTVGIGVFGRQSAEDEGLVIEDASPGREI